MTGCAFCAIATGEAPARVVYEDANTLAFFPDEPAVRGHTLVIPRGHVRDFLDASPAQAASVSGTCRTVGRALEAALSPQGMNAVTSRGQAATQTVFHLHVHLLPRWDGDALGDFWPDVPGTPEAELDAVAAAVRHALAG